MKGKPEKAKNFWGTTKRLLAYMNPWKWGIIAVIVFAIGSVIFQIVTPKILGKATTEVYKGVMSGYMQMKLGHAVSKFPIDFTKITHILITVAVCYVVSGVLSFAQQLIMANISQKIVYNLRRDMKEKMQRLPIEYYDMHSNGDIRPTRPSCGTTSSTAC